MFPAGSQVWVRCDDEQWWPALVRAPPPDAQPWGATGDIAVEFYHDPRQLFAVPPARARPLHRRDTERTAEERRWWLNPAVSAAVQRALAQPDTRPAGPPPPVALTPDELLRVEALLGAVDVDSAAELRQRLGLPTTAAPPRPAPLPPPPPPLAPSRSETPPPPAEEESPSPDDGGSCSDPASDRSSSSGGASGAGDFAEAADAAVLEVLRAEVFENNHKFVLSPVYRFLDVLGAVSVDSAAVLSTLPAPGAVREAPAAGFAPERRVLLVPLSEDYDHTVGWMQSVDLDGGRVMAMRVSVNGVAVPLPPAWAVPAAREATAVKTALSVDVTELVMGGSLFSLRVDFENPLDGETQLWSGLIACVFVQRDSVEDVVRRIAGRFTARGGKRLREERSPGGGVRVTDNSSRLVCPLAGTLMAIPARGRRCEHQQCMDLEALVRRCVFANVWNCPLCGEPTPPNEVCVDHRLREWMDGHRGLLARVDYVVQHEATGEFTAHLKPDTGRGAAARSAAIDVEEDN